MVETATAEVEPGLTREMTREDAEALVRNDPERAAFLLMALSAKLAQLQAAPSAPSSATPVYLKPTTSSGRKKKTKRGAKPGHTGTRRAAPPRIDRREQHAAERCPDCDSPLTPCTGKRATRTRVIEDIPADIQSEVVEHTIQRGYCASCKKTVEPNVPDALPGSTFGHRLVVFMAWLRFGLGVTLSQIREVMNAHLQFRVSDGGIVSASHRIAAILTPWYEQIAAAVKTAGVVNADETGWRVLGKTHWLWCFCSPSATYYMINR